MAVMYARVLEVSCGTLLVRERCTDQEMLVRTGRACRFAEGDCVLIVYNGAMTRSIPPQITANRIRRVSGRCCRCRCGGRTCC